jgi:hypothetical protein
VAASSASSEVKQPVFYTARPPDKVSLTEVRVLIDLEQLRAAPALEGIASPKAPTTTADVLLELG